MGRKKEVESVVEPVVEDKVEEVAIAGVDTVVNKNETLMVLEHILKQVEEFIASKPVREVPVPEGAEDLPMKRFKEKQAQVSGILLATVVSLKEVIGK